MLIAGFMQSTQNVYKIKKREIMTVFINKKFETVDDGIENLIAAAIHDYASQSYRSSEKMNKEFADGFVVKKGKKYIKILTNNGGSAWGFIVKTDTDNTAPNMPNNIAWVDKEAGIVPLSSLIFTKALPNLLDVSNAIIGPIIIAGTDINIPSTNANMPI